MRSPNLIALASFVLSAAILTGGAVCSRESQGGRGGNSPMPTPTPGPMIRVQQDIEPAATPPEDATVTLSGTPFEVKVLAEKSGTSFLIRMLKEGEEFDREEYEDSAGAFRLVMAVGERYQPPIDLLRYPMSVGERWTWNGECLANGHPTVATAEVDTAEDTQYVGGAPVKAIRSRVTLRFDAVGGEQAAERVLTFWFAPGKGVFRREYGTGSVREPAKD